jgi:hypothetical protein
MTIVDQYEQALAENAALTAKNAEQATQIAALTEAGAKAQTDISAKDELISKHVADVAKIDEALKAEQSAHAQTNATLGGELDKAKAILSNPAFAAAAAKGVNAATPEGGMPSTQEPMTREQAVKVYNSMPNNTQADAKALAAFREQNKEILGLK